MDPAGPDGVKVSAAAKAKIEAAGGRIDG